MFILLDKHECGDSIGAGQTFDPILAEGLILSGLTWVVHVYCPHLF